MVPVLDSSLPSSAGFGTLGRRSVPLPIDTSMRAQADYLTSCAKAFADLQMTTCISASIFWMPSDARYVRSSDLWVANYQTCADTVANALMLAAPFWWRLMQCLKGAANARTPSPIRQPIRAPAKCMHARRDLCRQPAPLCVVSSLVGSGCGCIAVYSITREQKNLWNALKYSTAFPLVYFGYWRRHAPSPLHDRYFAVAALIQSTYCFIWDVHMDWGLLRRDRRSACGVSLRQPLLVTRHKWVYGGLCMVNLMLRFAWALSIFGGT
jgi:hypothetical protein